MAYYTLLLLFAINLVNYLDRYLLSGTLDLIKIDLKLSDAQAGALMTAFMAVYMIVSPLFGWLGDRYSRKYLIAIGVSIWSFATAGAFWANSFAMLLFTRALVGVGEASYCTVSPTLIADTFSVQTRGRALSFFYMAIPVGSALGFMLGSAIGAKYGWHMAFLTMGLPGLLLAALILTIREPERGQSDNCTQKRQISLKESLVRMWHTPSFVYVTLGMAIMTFSVGGMAHWMPSFLTRCLNVPHAEAGLYFGAITVAGGFLGTFVGGWLGDWLQKRHTSAYFIVSGVGMFLSVPLAAWALTTKDLTIFLTTLFLAEFFVFFNSGPGTAIIANVSGPNMRSMAFAVNIFFIHILGDAVSPTIIGGISDFLAGRGMDTARSLNYSMYIMPFMMFLSGVLFLMGLPHLAKDMEKAKQPNP